MVDPIIIGAAVCCVIVTVSIGLAIGFTVDYHIDQKCNTTAKFADLPNNFTMDQKWIATFGSKATLKIDGMLGTYNTDPAWGARYVLRDENDNVVAEATKGFWSMTFEISRCSGKGDKYHLEQHWFNFGSIDYDLKKNEVLIAQPSKEIWFTCKPDIAMANMEGKTLATVDRSCGESFFLDKWKIQNYNNLTLAPANGNQSAVVFHIDQKEYIENYVLGFIAFLTTVAETDAAKSSSSSSKKN